MIRLSKILFNVKTLKYGNKSVQNHNARQYFWKSVLVINRISLLAGTKFKKNFQYPACTIHLSTKFNCKDKKSFLSFDDFQLSEHKNKKSFLDAIKLYKHNFPNRKGCLEFIQSARKQMKDFGVHEELEIYKKLLDLIPKGIYVATNKYQIGMFRYPHQQLCASELIEQMGFYGVIPDVELGEILKSIFGNHTLPVVRFQSLMYWSVKFKNKCPWEVPKKVPTNPLLLAELAIKQITSVDIQTKISVYQTEELLESNDKTWIVSAQSPKQKELLKNHMPSAPVIVEAGETVWLREKMIRYFVLKADCEPQVYTPPKSADDIFEMESMYFNPSYVEKKETDHSVHEQDDGIIYGICATGTSSKDSLLSWVRFLQKDGNPVLNDIPVLFRFKQDEKTLLPQAENETVTHLDNTAL